MSENVGIPQKKSGTRGETQAVIRKDGLLVSKRCNNWLKTVSV